MTTSTTIDLDEALLSRVAHFVPLDNLSALISELLEERVSQLERTETQAAMQTGYLALRVERQALNVDWQIVDGDAWPD
jgi:hypothetical protein